MDDATRARIAAHAARLAADAPELRPETKDRLAVLLAGTGRASERAGTARAAA